MTRRAKPRLGKGLSGLINQPVAIDLQTEPKIDRSPVPTPGSDPAVAASAPKSGEMASLATGSIRPNPYQPRQTFDQESLDQLADSIRRSGIIQPIAVRKVGGERGWELVAGERRWRAAQLAGLKTIPAVICEASDREAAERSLVENLQREDLNPMERAQAFQNLIERFGFSQSDVAQRVSLARASVANLLRLLELEPEIQEFLRTGQLSLGHGKALLGAARGSSRVGAARRAVAERWSVRQAERWASGETKRQSGQAKKVLGNEAPSQKTELERQLSEHMGTRVRLTSGSRSGQGRLTIEFYSLEQFDGLMEKIGFTMMS
ncbi:MAG: ParB/RepB/Spo0J family partition protein [Proteobacteria bacterium]|nr:ParB/RepB/Spo0J family partition protein [Pseudomonadota bacterium]